MIYVVLGMHKSGTTLVSQILHHSGIAMVDAIDENVSYDKGNKYERRSTLDLDVEILGHSDYDDILRAAPRETSLSEEQRARMQGIIADCSARHDDWGFKDPRCCLVYDLWAGQLPAHKLLVVYRHPAEIWHRFRWTGYRRLYRNYGLAYTFLCRWYDHNAAILDALSRTDRPRLVMRYRDLMRDDAVFGQLQDFCGRILEDRRRPDLYRSREKMDIHMRAANRVLRLRRGRSLEDLLRELAGYQR